VTRVETGDSQRRSDEMQVKNCPCSLICETDRRTRRRINQLERLRECLLCDVHVDGDGQSLFDFVNESARLPVTVCCSVAPDRSRDQWLHNQQLTISQLYDSTFLLANPIHNGTTLCHYSDALSHASVIKADNARAACTAIVCTGL